MRHVYVHMDIYDATIQNKRYNHFIYACFLARKRIIYLGVESVPQYGKPRYSNPSEYIIYQRDDKI